jgi:hypothetical protein
VCDDWLLGRVRASRLGAHMVERTYQQLETAGYSRTTLRTLHLVLSKAFGEQTGRTLGACKPRESDDVRPVWTLDEARRFLDPATLDVLTCGARKSGSTTPPACIR